MKSVYIVYFKQTVDDLWDKRWTILQILKAKPYSHKIWCVFTKKLFPLALQWNFYLAFFINFLQFSDFPKEPFGTSSLLQLQFPTLKYKNHENKLHAVGAGTFTAGLSLHSALGCDIGQHTSQGNSFYFLWY